jgi:hypothetical protein
MRAHQVRFLQPHGWAARRQLIPCRMALDRSTALLSLSLLLSMACTPTPKDGAETDAARGPDPVVICQHVRTLAAKDNSDEQALDQVQRECVQALAGLESRYATFASCVEAAATSAAVLECETALAKPPSLLGAASPTAQIEGLCDHVLSLLTAEIPDMGKSISPGEVASLRQRCITDAGATLQKAGPEAFAQQHACILAATNLQTLQACGSF